MNCCGCGSKLDFDTPGVVIKTVSAVVSPKSGKAIPSDDVFPDGSTEKFICSGCLLAKQELATLLGFYGTGFDFPIEEPAYEPTDLYSMPTPYL